MTPNWIQDAIFYQIFPDRFCNSGSSLNPRDTVPWNSAPQGHTFTGGDLKGIQSKLQHIANLGCTAIYLNPIFKAGTNHRYDTEDYFLIDPALGTLQDFKDLLDAAHQLNLKVILDGVFNHCSTLFAPFQDLLQHGEESRYRHWFTPYSFPLTHTPYANYATFGNHGSMPRLNTSEKDVQDYFIQVTLYWLSLGVNGWRMDVAFEADFLLWQRLREAVKSQYPEAYLVAEEWRDPFSYLQGDTFDGVMHYTLKDLWFGLAVHDGINAQAFVQAVQTLRNRLPAAHEKAMLTLLGSHDTPRVLTEARDREQTVKLLYTLLMTFPGAPMVYYGDEVGLNGGHDPACRKGMVWQEEHWNRSLYQHIASLIQLRKTQPELRQGTLEFLHADDRVVWYRRTENGQSTYVLINCTHMERDITLPFDAPDQTLMESLTGCSFSVRNGKLHLRSLAPRTSLVFTEVKSETPANPVLV
ncbi:glycoside hydrolase family 13 protein [Deinococcus roseus]|uniref:Neopullulanase n=1 Tax=Deinococcus roseus TaxID=392414 RepID=A0ABQ2DJC9_9DEIO|nr:glycoside hydrolase family 13 protein [Deinococcus roseus]GGJ59240.1 neopullulanase [Deinococcus roseus]